MGRSFYIIVGLTIRFRELKCIYLNTVSPSLSMSQIKGRLCGCVVVWQPHLSQHGVIDGAEVDGPFIRHIIINIEGSGGLRSLLLVTENQIDPLVKLAGHKFALQGL